MRIVNTVLLLTCILAGCVCCTENTESSNPPVQTPPVETVKRVTVATWNVHHFFDTVCDSGACQYGDFEKQFSQAEYEGKTSLVANGIGGIDADIILLQEIEKESCLTDVYNSFVPGIYTDYAFGEIGMPATVDVGILTRGKITALEKHRDKHSITLPDGSTKRIARELLQAEITLNNGLELTVFVTHLVSKATDPVGDRRLEEAKLCQQIVADYIAANPGRLVILGGDLNDYPDSAPMQAIEKDGLLVRSTEGMDPADYYTWQNSAAFDHLYYNAAFRQHLEKSERVCGTSAYSGYSDSDHCALKAVYRFDE